MNRLVTLTALLAVGCGMGESVRQGDQAYAAGDYQGATKHYQASLDEYRTPTEMKHVASRLIDAATASAEQQLARLDADAANVAPHDRVKALFDLWTNQRASALASTVVGHQISDRIDAIVETEWPSVSALAHAGRLSEAVALGHRWARVAPPNSVTRARYEALLTEASTLYSGLASDALEPAKSAFLQMAAHYGAAMPPAAETVLAQTRLVRIAFQPTGPAAEGCGSLPAAPHGDLLVALDVKTCASTDSVSKYEEDYGWTTTETRRETVQQCAMVEDGVEEVGSSSSESCHQVRNTSGITIGRRCTITTTVRTRPVLKKVCQSVEVSREYEIPHVGKRTVTKKTSTHLLEGEYSATLPDGRVYRAPFSFSKSSDELAWSTPQDDQALDGLSVRRAEEEALEGLLSAVDGEFVPVFHESRGRASLQAGRQARAAGNLPNADREFATAAILGSHDDDWLRSLGFNSENVVLALAGGSLVIVDARFDDSKVHAVELKSADAASLWGNDATAARGFPLAGFEVSARYRAVSDVPTQADRASVTVGITQRQALLSAMQLRNAWGFALWDRAEWFVDFGSRISEPHTYPDFGGRGEVERENWGSGGAGVSYQLAAGFRSNHFGIFAGAHAFADTFKLGDLAAANTGMPWMLIAELRANERYALRVHVYGFSPIGDRDLLGAELSFPTGRSGYLAASFRAENPTVNIGGINHDDRVRAGRRAATFASVSFGGAF